MEKRKIIEELIAFVGDAGGSEDFEQVKYWGYTFLECEPKQQTHQKFSVSGCPFCGTHDIDKSSETKYCYVCDKYWQNKKSKL